MPNLSFGSGIYNGYISGEFIIVVYSAETWDTLHSVKKYQFKISWSKASLDHVSAQGIDTL